MRGKHWGIRVGSVVTAWLLIVGVTIGVAATASSRVAATAFTASSASARPYAEPVVLSPSNGVLEVTLTARQGRATIDTAAGPVRNALLFGYSVQQGNASNGAMNAVDLYPGPTLQVNPGQKLIVHLENELEGLTIKDFSDPAFTPAGKAVSLYPAQLTEAPMNNHTHGLHVSPAGNSDNVLLNIPAGMANTYTYAIPADHPQGLYWYHSHRHMLTTAQTYRGLIGMLEIGRADGGIPAVTQNSLPVRTMALQYNYVFDRANGQTTLNNAFWPADLSTLKPATKQSLADGTYEPKLTPVNFTDTKPGTQYFTAWWTGPLSVDNNRGVFQYVPSNLQSFVGDDGKTLVPANPNLPDAQRDVQYTVNGAFQPVVSSAPGQTEIWVLGNFSEAAYMRVAITETATGQRTKLAVVAQDGNPYETVQTPPTENGTTLLIPPGSRYALAVTMPKTGGLSLEMPSYEGQGDITTKNMGILYTNNGTPKSPAVTGTVHLNPLSVSYMDGFFAYPTQTLLTTQPTTGSGTTVAFAQGQALNAYTSFDDLSNVKPAVQRTLVISGGFANTLSNPQDPNTFTYQFDGNQFPNIPLLQPRLNTSEQWNFVNQNNDQHPIHIHVNDFQVVDYFDPVAKLHLTNQPFGQDNQNTPAPLYNKSGSTVVTPGRMSLRTEFKQFIGAYVVHCHRLNHEDNGLMALINVIPNITAYTVAVPGDAKRPTRVTIINEDTHKTIAALAPFGASSAPVDVAMGDVNGDAILDLIVGAGKGAQPRVKVYSGAADTSGASFHAVLLDTLVFDPGFRGGVSVASANIDGTQNGDNVIVGSGSGMPATVKVLKSGTDVTTRSLFATWQPYGGFTGGIDVAAGLVDASGRSSVITAPGAGMEARIRTYMFDLYTPTAQHRAMATQMGQPVNSTNKPALTSDFLAFDSGFRGGVNLATGWVAGQEGGFSRIVAGQQSGGSSVAVFSSGSALEGHPGMYLVPADDYSMATTFIKSAAFQAFPGSSKGVQVATSANPSSADLLVGGFVGGTAKVKALNLQRTSKQAKQWSATTLYARDFGSSIGALGGR
ncbi:MAG: multicopper oxidase domain-containing protein [Actinomycetota bacterium]|nr:multicopper oxidase domain-containing protein [Actinomycetota bacterium]